MVLRQAQPLEFTRLCCQSVTLSTGGGATSGNRRTILTKQGWEKGVWGNRSVVIDNGTWHLMYECHDLNNIWRIGYVTSPDGITLTRQNGGNPINSLQVGSGMFGGPKPHQAFGRRPMPVGDRLPRGHVRETVDRHLPGC